MRVKQLKEYNTDWLRGYLEQSTFDADNICDTLRREYEYSKALLELIVIQGDTHEATKSIASGIALEVLRQVYNSVNKLTFEQGLKVEKEFRKRGFSE